MRTDKDNWRNLSDRRPRHERDEHTYRLGSPRYALNTRLWLRMWTRRQLPISRQHCRCFIHPLAIKFIKYPVFERFEVTLPALARFCRGPVTVGWFRPIFSVINPAHTPSLTRLPSASIVFFLFQKPGLKQRCC